MNLRKFIRVEISAFLDDGEDDDGVTAFDRVEDAVRECGDLADILVAGLGDDAAEPRQLGEPVNFIDEFPGHLLGAVGWLAGDVIVDGS